MPATGGSTRGLEISVSLKPSEAQAVSRVFQQITKSIQDAEKAASKLNSVIGGGSGVSSGTSNAAGNLTKGVKEVSKVFEQLATSSGKNLRIITEQAEREIAKQKRAYDSLRNALKGLEDDYERAAGGKFVSSGRLAEMGESVSQKTAEVDEARRKYRNARNAYLKYGLRNGSGTQILENPLAAGDGQESERGQSRLAAKIAAAISIANTGKAAADMYSQFYTRPMMNAVGVAAPHRHLYSRYIQGDFSDFAVMGVGRGRKNFGLSGGAQSYDNLGEVVDVTNAVGASKKVGGWLEGAAGVGSIALGAATIAAGTKGGGSIAPLVLATGVGQIESGLKQGQSAVDTLALGGREAAIGNTFVASLQAQKERNPELVAAVNDFFGGSNARMNIAQTQGGFGSYYRNVMRGVGYGMEEHQSAALMASLVGEMGNVRGNKMFDFASGMQRSYGIRREASAGLLGMLEAGTDGDTQSAQKRLEEIMARAFKAGMKDSRIVEELAGAVARGQYSLNSGGVVNPGAAAPFIESLGRNPSMNKIREFESGHQQVFSSLYTNATGAVGAINRFKIIQMLQSKGYAATGAEVEAIVQAGEGLKYGGSDDMQAIFGSDTGAIAKAALPFGMESFLDAGGVADPLVGKLYRQGGLGAIARNEKARALLGVTASAFGVAGSQGYQSVLKGFGNLDLGFDDLGVDDFAGSKDMGGKAGLVGGAAVASAKAKADPLKQAVENFSIPIQDAIQNAERYFKKVAEMGNEKVLDDAVVAIKAVTDALYEMRETLGAYGPRQPSPSRVGRPKPQIKTFPR